MQKVNSLCALDGRKQAISRILVWAKAQTSRDNHERIKPWTDNLIVRFGADGAAFLARSRRTLKEQNF